MLAVLFFQDGHGDILGPILSLTVSYSLSFLFNCFSRGPCGTKKYYLKSSWQIRQVARAKYGFFHRKMKIKTSKKGAQEKSLLGIVV